MGYIPSRADPNLFYKDKGDYYEHLASYMDDILVWSRDPMAIMDVLKRIYTIKGVGISEYYLGGNIQQLGEEWLKEGIQTGLSAWNYIEQVIPKFEGILGSKIKG